MNPAMDMLPRAQRRAALANEARLRKSGKWPPWVRHDVRGRLKAKGWASEFTDAVVNEVFAVLIRVLPDGTMHLMISSLSGTRPSWWEAQRIKNELVGEKTMAVEIYPPQDEVVDDADAYHLWALVNPLPYTLVSKT